MALKTFVVEIVTPYRVVVSGEYERFFAPSVEGYFEVLANHTPLLTTLDIGKVKLTRGGTREFFAVSGGFVEVYNNKVTVLAETAEAAEEVNVQRAQTSKERASRRLAHPDDPGTDIERARLSLRRALNRLSVSSH